MENKGITKYLKNNLCGNTIRGVIRMFKKKGVIISAIVSAFILCSGDATAATNGWVQVKGNWYYYKNGVKVVNKWQKDSKGWCFLSNIDGSWVKEGWAKDSRGWCYVKNGYWVQGAMWAKDSKGYVYIGCDGYWDGKPAVPSIPLDEKVTIPTGITAIGSSSSSIHVQWNKVIDADYYYLYYGNTAFGNYTPFVNSDGSKMKLLWYSDYSAALNNITPNTTRYFKVTAVKKGVESDYSNIACAATFSLNTPNNTTAYENQLLTLTTAYKEKVEYLNISARDKKKDITNECISMGLINNSYYTSKIEKVDNELKESLSKLLEEYDKEVDVLKQRYGVN